MRWCPVSLAHSPPGVVGRLARSVAGVLAVATTLALAGCPDNSSCRALGESCALLCCSGLSCHATATGGYCTKSCRCHGSSLCASTEFQEGCPQGSVCLAESSDGTGECVRLCDSSPCLPGEVVCDNPRDAGITCEVVPPPPDGGHD